MDVISSEQVDFAYKDNKMVSATYESDFVQNFVYDENGNLKSVNSSGSPKLQLYDITTDCKVEYATVIGKKDSEALNFITLPGESKKGLFNVGASTRAITLINIESGQTPFTQDFAGKLWWDEENIINNQVEVAKAKSKMSDSNSAKKTSSNKNESLNNEAKEAYKQKISEYAQFNKDDIKSYDWQTAGVNVLLLNQGDCELHYAFYDLNDDGVDELLIRIKSVYFKEDTGIGDAFSYIDGKVKRLFMSGERWRYILNKGGYLLYSGSGGYDTHADAIYKFEGEFKFENSNNSDPDADMKVIRECHTELYNSTGVAYYIREDGVKHSCTKEELDAEKQSWPAMEPETIDWIPISQS